MFCLNLCEMLTKDMLKEDVLEQFISLFVNKEQKVNRIYFGSSFCSQYFLQMRGYDILTRICQKDSIPLSLVVPVFSEKDLESGKKKIAKILEHAQHTLDEITVNDIGMLHWTANTNKLRICLGRLFFKDSRDFREPDLSKRTVSPVFLSHLNDNYWKPYSIAGIELDATNIVIDTSKQISSSIDIGIHMPYCYVTTGNICKFASIHKPISQKYRPNMLCAMDCAHIMEQYVKDRTPKEYSVILYRFGRTLYYKTTSVTFKGTKPSRVIYFPLDEWKDFKNENTSSIKR